MADFQHHGEPTGLVESTNVPGEFASRIPVSASQSHRPIGTQFKFDPVTRIRYVFQTSVVVHVASLFAIAWQGQPVDESCRLVSVVYVKGLNSYRGRVVALGVPLPG